jgi:hypothetical protein
MWQNLPLIVRIEVKEVMPHLPTVAADLAADGLFVFSLRGYQNENLHENFLRDGIFHIPLTFLKIKQNV